MKLPINQRIVDGRKALAPRLQGIIESAKACSGALVELDNAASVLPEGTGTLGDTIQECVEKLERVADRAAVRRGRFEAGLITIAIGGIEKSGKTTFLKTITQIDALPTATERCTAVCCEIHYSEGRSDFDLEFHTEDTFCEHVIRPTVEKFNDAARVAGASAGPIELVARLPRSLSEFEIVVLPSPGKFVDGTMPHILLEDLRDLQRHVRVLRDHLGRQPMVGNPLKKLGDWVSDAERAVDKARIATVARCIIRTAFSGGSANLRWIDTPGVDDPSPRARERTLETVARDADLLVVATMPGDRPSPTESFVNFWTSISNLPDEVRLMDRLLILLNWKKAVDPDGRELEKHKRYLEQQNRVPNHLFCGPLQAVAKEDVTRFMGDVNRHLEQYLPSQDLGVVERLENDLKSAMADVRRTVYDRARRLHPSDSSVADQELSLFLDWFERSEGSRLDGFMPRLRRGFASGVEAIPKSDGVQAAQGALDAAFMQRVERIMEALPDTAQMEQRRKTTAGEDPIIAFMQEFARGHYSELVNDMSVQVRDFGPVVQRAILDLLKDAGLGPLIGGSEARLELETLCNRLEEGMWRHASKNPVLAALKDLTALQQSLQYVYRYEMRPAVNMLNPLLWQQDAKCVGDLAKLIEANGQRDLAEKARRYFEKNPLPGMSATDEDRAKMFEQINHYALKGVQSVLSGGRCRLETIADDIIRDCQYRLTFGPVTEQAWRDLLATQRETLLGDPISRLRSSSDKIVAYRAAVSRLGDLLP